MTTRAKSSRAAEPAATTRSQKAAADVVALLRARNPLLWVVTREEARVEEYVLEAAMQAGFAPATWDCAQGPRTPSGDDARAGGSNDPGDMLDAIAARAASEGTDDVRTAWVMRDLPPWLRDFPGLPTLRKLRNLVRELPSVPTPRAQAIIVLSASADVPPELANTATVIEWPLPDREEIGEILDAAVGVLREDVRKNALPKGAREAAVDATVGLSGEEAQACYAKSLVQSRRIDPAAVAAEKKRVIARERVLEWYDPIPAGLDAVGGLENLKAWLVSRAAAYTPEARDYGLPAPRGTLLVGISGCGKTLTAKAVATAWSVPLIRFDLNALKSKFVGESEANIRKAQATVEALGRCVVWFDEVEKALAGATSGSADGGVSADALGSILSWMQERAGEAFIIATANDVSTLPPEFLRKGRFDEVWWVDLPNPGERRAIMDATLRSYKRDPDRVLTRAQADKVATACEGFTGAEIAAIVPEAMFAAFADSGREVEAGDLLAAAATVVPLAKTAEAKITAMRKWAEGRARPATSAAVARERSSSQARRIDL